MKNTTKTNSYVTALMAGSTLLLLSACSDTPPPKADIGTLETVKAEAAVNTYDAVGSHETKLMAERAFADLNKEIRELEVRVANTTGEKQAEAQYKLQELRKRSAELRGDFNEAKFNTLINDIKESVR